MYKRKHFLFLVLFFFPKRDLFCREALLNHTKTSLGKKRLKLWFQRPLRNKAELEQRFQTIEFFLSTDKTPLHQELQMLLSKQTNVIRIISQLRIKPSLSDWEGLIKVFFEKPWAKYLVLCGLWKNTIFFVRVFA